MNKKGKIILISGPSGVGKKTIIDEISKNKDLNLVFSISMTTRPKRENEIHGKDYFFKTKEEFLEEIKNNMLIEYEEFCGNYYGTPKQYVYDVINQGKNIIIEIEVKGAKTIFSKFNSDEMISIFIAPPSIDELKNRLLNRNTETIDAINNRVEVAKQELLEQKNYQHVVVNDVASNAIKQISEIILNNK